MNFSPGLCKKLAPLLHLINLYRKNIWSYELLVTLWISVIIHPCRINMVREVKGTKKEKKMSLTKFYVNSSNSLFK